jgi:hypothetical protein
MAYRLDHQRPYEDLRKPGLPYAITSRYGRTNSLVQNTNTRRKRWRARSSITSTILDDLDASNDLDVATDVATARGLNREESSGVAMSFDG